MQPVLKWWHDAAQLSAVQYGVHLQQSTRIILPADISKISYVVVHEK